VFFFKYLLFKKKKKKKKTKKIFKKKYTPATGLYLGLNYPKLQIQVGNLAEGPSVLFSAAKICAIDVCNSVLGISDCRQSDSH
jgi:hypothetical protein